MTTLNEDDVLERLEAQNSLASFMSVAHDILLSGIRQFLPSLFVDNDEEIVEYAVKPLLARSGPLDDIDVALRLIYALGKMDKWLYADITCFSQFCDFVQHSKETIQFHDDVTYDFIANLNSITQNATLFNAIKSMKYSDFSIYSEVRYGNLVKTALSLAVTSLLKELVW
ncbi:MULTISPECIES: MltR family transcriptional regulator [Buttiauxella]|uniref:Putative DNA-binding transcriptional regulator n=2 Tax=Buttiauxella TaxID=82976 RepID=A0A381C385_9ENTR|nr:MULTISPECIES: MltR family transcriptional regulator [Buttiauxella]MCS3603229.1 DNA-binding MltR family transcriptional regulator [Buttiauxella sp. BIGb0471]OAT22204.1 putative transcriptional regulator [Buttiauxella gaviniae ATCC 51604]BCG08089.1 transcriptional regulator [Buttiauxella agrestis]SUW62326.1 putative DNA-binding transcriptional regulator [Buttiauxella agrestis]